jgi:hypothetical protein
MNDGEIVLWVIGGLLALVVYFLPAMIAFWREHHYKWVIFAINLVFGLTGVGYLVAFIWAVWPQQTAILDFIANDPTTNSPEAGQKIYGQMGTNVRAFNEARDGRSLVLPPQMATAPQTQAELFCFNCGKPMRSGAHFCASCGVAVSG